MDAFEAGDSRENLATSPKLKRKISDKADKCVVSTTTTPVANHLKHLMGEDEFKQSMIAELVNEIKMTHEVVLGGFITITAKAIRCGGCLLQLKLAIGSGNWLSTFETHLAPLLGFTKRTMQRYIVEYHAFQRFLAEAEPTEIEALTEGERIALFGRSKHSVKDRVNLTKSSEVTFDDWLTPDAIVESVRCYFGALIDTDPCASRHAANQLATTCYSLTDGVEGGLSADLPWQGNVFIAPGLKMDLTPWVEKAFLQLEGGQMEQGILFAPISLIASIEALLAFPITIIKSELAATRLLNDSKSKQISLPPMGLVLIARKPEVNRLVGCLRDIGVVYAPAN